MEDAKWYFTHETEEDRLWYQLFFSLCDKFNVSWGKATSKQRAFIEELTRLDFDLEMAMRGKSVNPVRGFFEPTTE